MSKEAAKIDRALHHQEESYAFFLLDGREFGIRVDYVHETILHRGPLTQLPCSLDALDGLINLRGSIIPIINLRTRFNLQPAPPTAENPLAIVQFNGGLFGLRFDEISEVVRVRQSEISRIDTREEDLELCSQGLLSLDGGDRIVQLLDLERLFRKYNLPLISHDGAGAGRSFRPLKQDITLMLNGQEFAIAIEAIKEIIKPPKIKRKVLVDPAIKGVIVLRDELVNIVDLRLHFKYPSEEITPESRIIILQGDVPCGILVDAIREVIHYEEDQLLPVPILGQGQECFAGIVALEPGRSIVKLDPARLFDETLLKHLRGNADLHAELAGKKSVDENRRQDKGSLEIVNRVLISFRLGEDYAFDIDLFREIINYSAEITALPGLPAYHEGILNLRHSAIPIINLRKYYRMENHARLEDAKIIILNLPGKNIGIMVDDIMEIVKPDRMQIERIPNLSVHHQGQTGNHIREGYRFKTARGEEKSLLIYDVEQLIRDLGIFTEEEPLKIATEA